MRSEKPILTISVAADLLQLHPRTLMQYESSGLFQPHRIKSNRRLYSQNDLRDLQFIKFLTQEKGINHEGVKYILKAIQLTNQAGGDLKRRLFPEFKPQRLI